MSSSTATVNAMFAALTDFGPLSELLARNDIEEVFIEGGRVSYLDTLGRLRGLTVPTRSPRRARSDSAARPRSQ